MRLFLCEKPSQGKDIGRILGATQRGEGCLNGSGVTVTWCIGHLVEAAAPEVYDAALKRWSLEQLPIIPQQWRVEVKPKTATQFKVVKALLAKATQLVIATDADREGELIAREIIDLCGYRGPIERLWLSALNDASIRTALAKLRPSAETLPMYYSALARSRQRRSGPGPGTSHRRHRAADPPGVEFWRDTHDSGRHLAAGRCLQGPDSRATRHLPGSDLRTV